jgi:hypothetical protein
MGPTDSETRYIDDETDYRGCGTAPHLAAARLLVQGSPVVGGCSADSLGCHLRGLATMQAAAPHGIDAHKTAPASRRTKTRKNPKTIRQKRATRKHCYPLMARPFEQLPVLKVRLLMALHRLLEWSPYARFARRQALRGLTIYALHPAIHAHPDDVKPLAGRTQALLAHKATLVIALSIPLICYSRGTALAACGTASTVAP